MGRWVRALVLVAAGMTALVPGTAMAGDRPLFDFRGELPVPGGTLRLEARCNAGSDWLACRTAGWGPSGRGFRLEGRFRLLPEAAPAEPEPTAPRPSSPRWF